MRLPLAVRAQPAVESNAGVGGVARDVVLNANAQRILVVDDNEDGMATIVRILKLKGYDTRAARDAPTALLVAAEFLPMTALLDIGLPVMNGYELASRLRNLSGLTARREPSARSKYRLP